MSDGPLLKQTPEDFLVRESMVVQLCEPCHAEFRYALLRKRGYTTSEAVAWIGEHLQVDAADVGYGGRKDEDAITEQLISLPREIDWPESPAAWRHEDPPERWLEIHHYGYGRSPLRIGQVEGNGFRVVVRNLDFGQAAQLSNQRGRTALFFLNYYDTQRFGVPAGPKRTHFVGRAMLEGRWGDAIEELTQLGSPESAAARDWSGPALAFFERLEPRVRAFFLAAHVSDRWNQALSERVALCCPPQERVSVTVEGIRFRYTSSPEAAVRLLSRGYTIPYRRYEYRGSDLIAHPLQRATTVQTFLTVEDPEEDAYNRRRYAAALKFFLPSGCYGTAALRQMLLYLARESRHSDAPSTIAS